MNLPMPLPRNWWAVVVRGLLAVGFCVVALMMPRLTLALLLVMFGTYALYDGVFAVISAVRTRRRQERWWPLALEGFFGVVVGLIAVLTPVAASSIVFIAIGIWALATGALEIVAGAKMRGLMKGAWLLTLSGVLRLAFGGVLLARRSESLFTLVSYMAFYALAYGIVLVTLGIQLRLNRASEGRRPPHPTAGVPQPV
jgi:uncharacterized membrane protein HdeD (DUF308 family)